jgi:hypothetical protein
MYKEVQMPQETWMPGVASEAISLWNQSVGDCFVTAFLAMTGYVNQSGFLNHQTMTALLQFSGIPLARIWIPVCRLPLPAVSLSWCAPSGHNTAETNTYLTA